MASFRRPAIPPPSLRNNYVASPRGANDAVAELADHRPPLEIQDRHLLFGPQSELNQHYVRRLVLHPSPERLNCYQSRNRERCPSARLPQRPPPLLPYRPPGQLGGGHSVEERRSNVKNDPCKTAGCKTPYFGVKALTGLCSACSGKERNAALSGWSRPASILSKMQAEDAEVRSRNTAAAKFLSSDSPPASSTAAAAAAARFSKPTKPPTNPTAAAAADSFFEAAASTREKDPGAAEAVGRRAYRAQSPPPPQSQSQPQSQSEHDKQDVVGLNRGGAMVASRGKEEQRQRWPYKVAETPKWALAETEAKPLKTEARALASPVLSYHFSIPEAPMEA
eukprot:CAMPEP_0171873214 /NCGR_PEP_ID=MMETSP0992-20121227/34262_1 /TAXON_ID=483369 /ORGANISM="non described non described, Strain CCMP2098" /LENGTH=336 /DNA_ID=CAMNT_0012497819 /DNA_START=67 /DNA_END=1075 /DNA_ORIENTATION=+